MLQITIEPESDTESHTSEENTKMRSDSKTRTKSSSKKLKLDEGHHETNASNGEFNENFDEIDVNDPKTHTEEQSDKLDVGVETHQLPSRLTSIDSETSKAPNDKDKFGAMVSSKLLLMSPLQRLLSQKIISEILLKGQFGMLKSSLCPVVVNGYMKNISNSATNTTNLLSSAPSTDGDSDPLMFQVKQEINTDDTDYEPLVKEEVSWSDWS